MKTIGRRDSTMHPGAALAVAAFALWAAGPAAAQSPAEAARPAATAMPAATPHPAATAMPAATPHPAANARPAKPASVVVRPIAARPEDVGSIDGMMKAFYEVISGPAGTPRQWSRDRTLYIPNVRFVQMSLSKDGKPVAKVVSHQEFVDGSDPGLKGGFYETEIHRETKRFGNIAHVFSTYESKKTEDGKAFARGVNSIELFWDGARWWIANAIWDEERPDNPLPKDLLP